MSEKWNYAVIVHLKWQKWFYINWTQKQSSRNQLFPFCHFLLIFFAKVKFTQTLELLSVSLAGHRFDGRSRLRFNSCFLGRSCLHFPCDFSHVSKCFCGRIQAFFIYSSHWRVFVVGNTFKTGHVHQCALSANKSPLIIWIIFQSKFVGKENRASKQSCAPFDVICAIEETSYLGSTWLDSFASTWADGTFISGGQFSMPPLHSQPMVVDKSLIIHQEMECGSRTLVNVNVVRNRGTGREPC